MAKPPQGATSPRPPALFVLSGGPCSGKTTLLSELERRGHAVVTEAATDLILATPESRRGDPVTFQRTVLELQLERESAARRAGSPTGLVFLDRSIGDNFGYLRVAGATAFPELVDAWTRYRDHYRAIFFLSQNPDYTSAVYRWESPEEAPRVSRILLEAYRELVAARPEPRPRLVEIPWAPVTARADLAESICTEALRESRGESAAED